MSAGKRGPGWVGWLILVALLWYAFRNPAQAAGQVGSIVSALDTFITNL